MQNPISLMFWTPHAQKKWGASLEADARGLRSSTDGSAQNRVVVLQSPTWCSQITRTIKHHNPNPDSQKTLDTTNTDQYTYDVEIEDQYVRSCSYPIVSCHACRASEPMRHPAGTTLAVGFLFSAVVAGKSPYDEYFTQSPLVQTASL